jgi:hypothetical protein
MNKIKFIFTTAVIIVILSGQQKPCENPAASQFDFWIGDWELTWQDNEGNIITGSNKIEKILDGCVINENFYDSSSGFTGRSLSVYSTKLNKWLQTWVDNSGAYLDFVGGWPMTK